MFAGDAEADIPDHLLHSTDPVFRDNLMASRNVVAATEMVAPGNRQTGGGLASSACL